MLMRPRGRYVNLVLATGLVLGLQAASAEAGTITGPIVNPANSHSYYLLTSDTWTASEAEAITLGGHLATINDLAENQWIFDTFIPHALATGNTLPLLWIGLNDAAVEGTFVWASGEPVTFTHWLTGAPNGGSAENYVHMQTPGAAQPGRWNDKDNSSTLNVSQLFGVVEVAAVVPEPSGLVQAGLGLVGLAGYAGWWRRRAMRSAGWHWRGA